MKYYDEDEMKEMREILEKEVLKWPGVTTKKMFGCPCYQVDGKLFSFLVTNGVVLAKLSEPERERISTNFEAEPFQAGKKMVGSWLRIPMDSSSGLVRLFPHIRSAYEAAKE